MTGDALLWLAGALAVAGVVLLRTAWSRPSRSAALNAAGWGSLAASAVAGAMTAGAWGVTVASLVAMTAASVLLAAAAFERPRWNRKPASRSAPNAAVVAIPNVGGRLLTFLVAGPFALAAGLALALAVRGLMLTAGAEEADGNAATLALLPIVWPLLAMALLMTESRAVQVRWLLGSTGAAAVVILLTGGVT